MGIKDYIAKKKVSFAEYREKRELQKREKEKTRQLQAKLERQSLIEEGALARREIREIKETERAKSDLAAVKKYQREQKFKSSPFGKFMSGFDKFGESIEQISGVSEKFGAKKQSLDPFGGDMMGVGGFGGKRQSLDPFGGDMMGMRSPKKKKKKRKKK